MAQTAEYMEIVLRSSPPDEAYEDFDSEVHRLMDGMTGEEFIRRWQAGEFETVADQPGSRHIMRLILMMPGGDNRSE